MVSSSASTAILIQAKEYINSIDFSMIIKKMVQDGWCRQDALATCDLYRNFLYLTKKYAGEGVVPPSEDVDEFWHYHILDTRKYIDDCQQIFGSYLHHYPYLILDHQINNKQLREAFEKTQQLHLQEFGVPIYQTRSRLRRVRAKLKKLFC